MEGKSTKYQNQRNIEISGLFDISKPRYAIWFLSSCFCLPPAAFCLGRKLMFHCSWLFIFLFIAFLGIKIFLFINFYEHHFDELDGIEWFISSKYILYYTMKSVFITHWSLDIVMKLVMLIIVFFLRRRVSLCTLTQQPILLILSSLLSPNSKNHVVIHSGSLFVVGLVQWDKWERTLKRYNNCMTSSPY